MVKTLSQYGEHTVLILEQELLDQLHIDVKTPLNVETDGETLIISPVRDAEHQKKFQETLANVNQKYGHLLQRLAE